MTSTRYSMTAVVALMLAAAQPGWAQSENPTGVAATYSFGTTTIEDDDAPGDTFRGRDTGWNLDLEWRFLEYLAFGFNVTSFGEDTDFFNGEDTTIGVDGFGFFVRGYWPVTDNVTLHARYGETNYDVDSSPGFGTTFPFNSQDAKDFGIGGDYYFTEKFALRLETRLLDGPNKEAGSLTSLGLRWQF